MRGLLATVLLSIASMSFASIDVIGTFEASTECAAYLSKLQKTNPDNLMTTPTTVYKLLEVNRSNNPNWFRIVIPNTIYYPLRWVQMECGTVNYLEEQQQICEQSPGLANSYIIALSSQAGFCETYGYEAGKPECQRLSPSSYAASHLVLHGLWPNQNRCGEHYGFCGVNPEPHHCDYSPIPLSDAVARELKIVMPSFAFGSCLERHEWNKHGSCQHLSSNDYFALATRLAQEMNSTPLGEFLHEQRGHLVTHKQLLEKISVSFGKKALLKVHLGCKKRMLVDIFIQLPSVIPEEESLVSLVQKAPEVATNTGCPESIKISDFTSMP